MELKELIKQSSYSNQKQASIKTKIFNKKDCYGRKTISEIKKLLFLLSALLK
jgi:hypothetical protein